MTSWKKRKDQILYDKDYDFIGSLNQIDKRNNLADCKIKLNTSFKY